MPNVLPLVGQAAGLAAVGLSFIDGDEISKKIKKQVAGVTKVQSVTVNRSWYPVRPAATFDFTTQSYTDREHVLTIRLGLHRHEPSYPHSINFSAYLSIICNVLSRCRHNFYLADTSSVLCNKKSERCLCWGRCNFNFQNLVCIMSLSCYKRIGFSFTVVAPYLLFVLFTDVLIYYIFLKI